MFAPTNYGEGLDNKAVVGMGKDAEGGGKVGEQTSAQKYIFSSSRNVEKPPKSFFLVPRMTLRR